MIHVHVLSMFTKYIEETALTSSLIMIHNVLPDSDLIEYNEPWYTSTDALKKRMLWNTLLMKLIGSQELYHVCR